MNYDLSHLTQPSTQDLRGPIQDDEALLLYATIKVMRIKNILEIGGLSGYSARNFLQAIEPDGKVFTCDIIPVPKLNENHTVIQKSVSDLTKEDLQHTKFDLIFFDCHHYKLQMEFLEKIKQYSLFDDSGIIALHDTNSIPFRRKKSMKFTEQGFLPCPQERRMVNDLVDQGYHAFCFHTKLESHDEKLPYRCGITLMKKFQKLLC